ncbi:hypothetical protein [Streptomyces sp. DH12]|uniref:hypothetical protein n=1 Tax=Streptomyces sp. DH12 TaxID=2857010 RepID=UPI001E4FB9B8|nr:hypothetical protein [Streptomyces sp. DH12]
METFDYPQAAKVLDEQGIKLIKGDGHILLADCADARDIQVQTSLQHPGQTTRGQYCFKVTGSAGFLTLELPKVYGIVTGDVAVSADLTADGTKKTVEVGENTVKGVGLAGTPPTGPTVLVELRVKG